MLPINRSDMLLWTGSITTMCFILDRIARGEPCPRKRGNAPGAIDKIAGVQERLYAVTVERRIKHPSVAAFCDAAARMEIVDIADKQI
jgi:hypothetical protein